MQVENKYAFRGVVYSILAAVNIAAVVAITPIYGPIGAAACTGFLMFIGNGVVMNVFYAKVIKLDIAGYWKGIARVCFPLMLFGLMFYFVWKMNGIVIGGWGEFRTLDTCLRIAVSHRGLSLQHEWLREGARAGYAGQNIKIRANKMMNWGCGRFFEPATLPALDWSRFLGRKNKLLQATSRSRSQGAL